MLKSNAAQQRQNERFKAELPVEFKAKQKVVAAHLANIGVGGMCIRTTDVLPVKSFSFFRIVDKGSAINFNIEAEVVWSQPQSKIRQRRNKRPGMMGLRFVKSRFITEETIAGILKNINNTIVLSSPL